MGVGAAVYLGVMVTVLGLFLWLHLLRVLPARVAASIQYLQPIIGVGAAALMFGDELGPLFIAGVGCVLLELALTVTNARKPEQGQIPTYTGRESSRGPRGNVAPTAELSSSPETGPLER